jgi:hypothetical protein
MGIQEAEKLSRIDRIEHKTHCAAWAYTAEQD